MHSARRPVALVTGVGRRQGLGAAIALELARAGWDVGFTFWKPFDQAMPWDTDDEGPAAVADSIGAAGASTAAIEADLAVVESPGRVFDAVEADLGPVDALIVSHCECVPSSTLDTTPEGFDRHYAVNVRGTWLLIREFARRFAGTARGAGGRIVTLTSDHVVGNLPYGATKAAADRITLAAAHDLAHLGITANAINPGPVDTGWMTEAGRAEVAARTALDREAVPGDVAHLVRFLCSGDGGWITGQLLYSNGGFRSTLS